MLRPSDRSEVSPILRAVSITVAATLLAAGAAVALAVGHEFRTGTLAVFDVVAPPPAARDAAPRHAPVAPITHAAPRHSAPPAPDTVPAPAFAPVAPAERTVETPVHARPAVSGAPVASARPVARGRAARAVPTRIAVGHRAPAFDDAAPWATGVYR